MPVRAGDDPPAAARAGGHESPLIGFAGAPFTLAGYLVEGKPSRDFVRTKQLMYGEPELWHDADGAAGGHRRSPTARRRSRRASQALQLFDSWVGALSPRDYARYVQPHMRRIFAALTPPGAGHVPLIHFGTGTAALLELMADGGRRRDRRWTGACRWTRPGARRRAGACGVQGNLDPAVLLAPWDVVRAEAEDVLRAAGGRPGHIFNLGHGVCRTTPVETLERLVAFVHDYESIATG